MSEKSTFFKELTPRSLTYELRGQGKKKEIYKIKTNKHLTVLQKLSQKLSRTPLTKHLFHEVTYPSQVAENGENWYADNYK